MTHSLVMNLIVVAGVWLSLSVLLCLVFARGIAGDQPAAEVAAVLPAPVAPARTFTTPAVHEWALAAHDVATGELLSTRPAAIRRVAAR